MAMKKSTKKILWVVGLVLLAPVLLSSFVPATDGTWINDLGADQSAQFSNVKRTGLNTYSLAGGWSGVSSNFGRTISWVNTNGSKSVWTKS